MLPVTKDNAAHIAHTGAVYKYFAGRDSTCDFAGFGRMTFAYPSFYKDYLKNGTLDKNKVCIKCSKCSELMRAGTVSGCVIRDSEKYMPYYREYVMKK